MPKTKAIGPRLRHGQRLCAPKSKRKEQPKGALMRTPTVAVLLKMLLRCRRHLGAVVHQQVLASRTVNYPRGDYNISADTGIVGRIVRMRSVAAAVCLAAWPGDRIACFITA